MLQSGQGKEELLLRNPFQVNTVNLKLKKRIMVKSVFTIKIELKYIRLQVYEELVSVQKYASYVLCSAYCCNSVLVNGTHFTQSSR